MQNLQLSELATLPVKTGNNLGLGERRLLAAVLRQTLDDLTEHGNRSDPNSRRIFDTAAAWIFADRHRESDEFLSFARTCDLLGLDAGYVRNLVRRLIDTHQRLRTSAA